MPNFFREQEQVEVLSGDELGGSFKVHHPVFIIIFQMLGGEKSQRDTALRDIPHLMINSFNRLCLVPFSFRLNSVSS